MNGTLRVRDRIVTKSIGRAHEVDQVGVFTPKRLQRQSLSAGEVGFVVAGIKDIHGAPVGDTITHLKTADSAPAPGVIAIEGDLGVGSSASGTERLQRPQHDSADAAFER